MDANTVELWRAIIAAGVAVFIFGGLFWLIAHLDGRDRLDISAIQPTNDWYVSRTTWDDLMYDEDDEDWQQERQALRDRLACALWENRRLKRQRPLDEQVRWKVDDLAKRIESWEGEL